jgi:chromosome segregation ATPase
MAEKDQDGQWLNLTEAAHRLGWSRERLRSHARRGRIRTMRGNAGELLVLVTSDLTGAAKGGQTGAVQTRAVRDGQTDQEIANLRAELMAARDRAARAEGELAAGQRTEAAMHELVDELKQQLSRERGRRREAEARLARPWWRWFVRG